MFITHVHLSSMMMIVIIVESSQIGLHFALVIVIMYHNLKFLDVIAVFRSIGCYFHFPL
jgi:hypothetical protein